MTTPTSLVLAALLLCSCAVTRFRSCDKDTCAMTTKSYCFHSSVNVKDANSLKVNIEWKFNIHYSPSTFKSHHMCKPPDLHNFTSSFIYSLPTSETYLLHIQIASTHSKKTSPASHR